MPEFLVIRLHASSAASNEGLEAEWLVVDANGAPSSRMHSGRVVDSAVHAAGRKVIALVPGTDVLLAEPVLPLKSAAKLAQVVPFALEEQLAADVEDLHFALGKRDGRAGTPVAVASHARMETWLSMLRGAGLQVDALYAETALLPITPAGVSILIDGARVYVRRESTPGAVLDVEPLIEALQLALASGDEAREHVTIYVTEDDYDRERELLEGLREFTASLQLKLVPDGALTLLAASAVQGTQVNLLQGQYAPPSKLKISFAPWRYVAAFAVVFFALHLGVKSWQYFHWTAMEARLDNQIVEVFQQAMPGAAVPEPSAARRQMESRLSTLRGSGPTGGMLATLGTISEALAQAPGTQVEALAYRNSTTDLRVLAPSVDMLDRLQHAATERGLAAQIQSTGARESKTEARLQFKTPGA